MTRTMKHAVLAAVVSASLCVATAGSAAAHGRGKWLSGDFHQHTFYTDGKTSFSFVMEKNNEFGLDWWANSEHGGARKTDGEGVPWLDTTKYSKNPILGENPEAGYMYRWQSLRDFVYPDILKARATYPDKRIFSGMEWNVPAHEHCSVGAVSEKMGPLAISAFDFQFDKSDKDTSRTGEWSPFGVLAKHNGTDADAVAACAWMEDQYKKSLIDNAWIIFAHIERDGTWDSSTGKGGYNIENFRNFNNAAPDICFGFEGAPGHQANHWRGFGNPVTCDDTGNCTSKDFGGTYGGVGFYTAKVGGLWDALLGEGRRWFNYTSSDYHRHYTAGGDDFYPGEYQKTYVYAIDRDRDGKYSLTEIADALRSGNAYFVHGDLINALEFKANSMSMMDEAVMGEAMTTKEPVTIAIKFKSPKKNNNGDRPVVDHIDLIAGKITGKVDPDSPDYKKAVNETTRVIATFTAKDWKRDHDGFNVITYNIKDLDSSMYFRLRGTNLAPNTAYETDAAGNPLPDALATQNLGLDGASEAWADLWFYSNPIFVYVD